MTGTKRSVSHEEEQHSSPVEHRKETRTLVLSTMNDYLEPERMELPSLD